MVGKPSNGRSFERRVKTNVFSIVFGEQNWGKAIGLRNLSCPNDVATSDRLNILGAELTVLQGQPVISGVMMLRRHEGDYKATFEDIRTLL